MEWGIMMAAAGLFLMVVLMLENVDAYVVDETVRLPNFEPEDESLAINLADYKLA